MWCCYRTNISHAAITSLTSVLVEYLMKSIIAWKMLFYQFLKCLTGLFNSYWHISSTVTGTIAQQWLAWFFSSHWHDCSTVTGTIIRQWLAWSFNSHGQEFFFFLCWQNSSTVWCSLLKNCVMYQDNERWSLVLAPNFFIVKPLPSTLPWPVTFPQNIFWC